MAAIGGARASAIRQAVRSRESRHTLSSGSRRSDACLARLLSASRGTLYWLRAERILCGGFANRGAASAPGLPQGVPACSSSPWIDCNAASGAPCGLAEGGVPCWGPERCAAASAVGAETDPLRAPEPRPPVVPHCAMGHPHNEPPFHRAGAKIRRRSTAVKGKLGMPGGESLRHSASIRLIPTTVSSYAEDERPSAAIGVSCARNNHLRLRGGR